ncbi:TPA: scsC protein, partial [Escherichia coli]|nr:scsC protein [Escherichia coli]
TKGCLIANFATVPADFIRTHEPRPLRDGLAVLAALKETARIR